MKMNSRKQHYDCKGCTYNYGDYCANDSEGDIYMFPKATRCKGFEKNGGAPPNYFESAFNSDND